MRALLTNLLSLLLMRWAVSGRPDGRKHDPTVSGCETTAAPDTDDGWETVEDGVYFYEMPSLMSAKAEYVSDAEKAKWKEPLTALLATLHAHPYTVEVDPNAEYPEDRYMMVEGCEGVALFDVTADGIPEVAVRYAGGSAGNSFFYLYDLYSGQKIGFFDSGWTDDTRYGDWAIYRSKAGNDAPFGCYNFRIGAARTETFFATVREIGGEWIYTVPLMLSRDYDILIGDDGYTETDLGYTFYKKTQDGTQPIDVSEFEADLRAFAEEYTRIEGTEMINIEWRELDGYTDETPQNILAEKMAEALLQTKQRFVAR
ncbi:MAG: hypothetical protein IJZ80_10795 [Clostridia bacterium]|nr:hypothetical protein [Clostridia bacterium]